MLPKSAARAANCRASALLSAPTPHPQHAVVVTPRVVARPRVGVARLRVDAAHRLADATLQPARAGNTAKHRQTRRAVKVGHRKIVAAPRDLAKAATIHVVATARRATAHRAVARLRQVVATLVHRVHHLEQAAAKAIASLHPQVAAVATAAGVATAAAVAEATAAITAVVQVADQATAVVVAPAATVVVKVTAHRARAGVSVVSRRRGGAAKVVMATVPVAIRAAAMGLATAATTVAHPRRAQLTVVATTQAALTVRRAQAAGAAAGAIAMA